MNKTTELLNLIKWMAIQAQLQLAPQSQFPERKQIWWACLGQNIGIETNGKNYRFERPVLVIKAFNACALFVAPLTSTLGTHQFLIEFNHLGQKKSVNVSQLRTLSAKRFTKKISDMSDADFDRIISSIQKIVLNKPETPQSGVSFELPHEVE
jgi:mRNA-degrading endonuclease toxin of MazEF toxin-antitoxin module